MMTPRKLLQVKNRILIASELAAKIGGLSPDEALELEQEDYNAAIEALSSLSSDVSLIFVELDVLRGMFAEKVAEFFTEVTGDGEKLCDEGSTGSQQDDVGDDEVAESAQPDTSDTTKRGVRKKKTTRRSSKVRDDKATTNKRPRTGGRTRKQPKRSDAGTDKGGNEEDKGDMDK